MKYELGRGWHASINFRDVRGRAQGSAARQFNESNPPAQELWLLNRPTRSKFPVRASEGNANDAKADLAASVSVASREAEVVRQVSSGRRQVNTERRITALEEARVNRLCPSAHAVSLFYAGPDPVNPLGIRIHTVSRWVCPRPEADQLPQMLEALDRTTRTSIAAAGGRPWDPRGPERPLVDVGDLHMPRVTTQYVGVGVETLDTGIGNWADIAGPLAEMDNTVASRALRDLPCEAAALLTTGSHVRVTREGHQPVGPAGGTPGVRPPWTGRPYERTQPTTDTLGGTMRPAWPHLEALARTLHRYLDPGPADTHVGRPSDSPQ